MGVVENHEILQEQVHAVCAAFALEGQVQNVQPCGNGHINHTFLVTTDRRRYILQVVNTDIFKRPVEVMENILRVTEHIRTHLASCGGDVERGSMRVVPSAADPAIYWHIDGDGRFWRAYHYIEHTICRTTVDSPETFARVGFAFGHFQRQLADFDASLLHESIPDFHNTKLRYAHFLDTVQADPVGRLASVRPEVDFIRARAYACPMIVDALTEGRLPLRVTHNDTKLSNILLDETTGESVCIIDLDTVMPGSALYDFGDSIRAGACSAAEDEADLTKVFFRPEMFMAYAKGFVDGTDGVLTATEKEMLPWGAYVITLEQAIRFLDDYLCGDTYYHTAYAEHNLVRTRTQLRMLEGMEGAWEALCRDVAQL